MHGARSTRYIRKMLIECGVPNPSIRCVKIVAEECERCCDSRYWELKFSKRRIKEVVQSGLSENKVISSVQEEMRIQNLEKPTPDMVEKLLPAWREVFEPLLSNKVA